MKYCLNCTQELLDDAKKCNCGGSNFTKKLRIAEVTFPQAIWDILDDKELDLKKFGEKDTTIIANIVLNYLDNQGYLEEGE